MIPSKMPDRPLTVLTYAASASLAAVALVYFFNPNYLIDGDSASGSANARKRGVVGLFNPANDCFINSILQSLAGLGDLRLYLIRETHRRDLDGPAIYEATPPTDAKGKQVNVEKLVSLQSGEVTRGLKDMIDRLNERPIARKTISALPFIRILEHAFGTRIAKSQQDAQELLQIVAERLLEEYQAGRQARQRARRPARLAIEEEDTNAGLVSSADTALDTQSQSVSTGKRDTSTDEGHRRSEDLPVERDSEEDGFPLEGQVETKTECTFCKFIPKVKPSSFVMLTLTVPQKNSATLNECIDGHFKTEYIDDYTCDKCRLVHALGTKERDLVRAKTTKEREAAEMAIVKLEKAIQEDPEELPKGIPLPDTKLAPKRKIGRYAEIIKFPKILVIHLSRSIYDPRSSSTKNMSRLSFPERLPMGGLLKRRYYKLLGVVTHRGTHNNGHYETFRRQHLYPPFANPLSNNPNGPYNPQEVSRLSTSSAPAPEEYPPTPKHTASVRGGSSMHSTSPTDSSLRSPGSTRPTSGVTQASTSGGKTATPSPSEKPSLTSNGVPRPALQEKNIRPQTGGLAHEGSRFRRKKKVADRWWRISDDTVKECKTGDVLGMQKEVYMLFYEVEKDDGTT